MKKKTLFVLLGIGLLGAVLLLALQNYKLDLIHYVVVNAMLQKSPQSLETEIQSAFEEARRRAEFEEEQNTYIAKLLAFSQRLEKVQRLSPDSARAMLEEVRHYDRPVIDPDAVKEP